MKKNRSISRYEYLYMDILTTEYIQDHLCYFPKYLSLSFGVITLQKIDKSIFENDEQLTQKYLSIFYPNTKGVFATFIDDTMENNTLIYFVCSAEIAKGIPGIICYVKAYYSRFTDTCLIKKPVSSVHKNFRKLLVL